MSDAKNPPRYLELEHVRVRLDLGVVVDDDTSIATVRIELTDALRSALQQAPPPTAAKAKAAMASGSAPRILEVKGPISSKCVHVQPIAGAPGSGDIEYAESDDATSGNAVAKWTSPSGNSVDSAEFETKGRGKVWALQHGKRSKPWQISG